MDLQCLPPLSGEPSFELFQRESQSIMGELSRKAALITQAFNNMTNTFCSPCVGSLFAFPQIRFSPRALEAAAKAGLPPDTYYASCLLEKTGVCVSSGNIFGQKEDTFHIRLTLMPSEEKVKIALERIRQFNEEFHGQYAKY
jgi:aspartate/methionine/tyrosine aminotransferase